MSKISRCPFCGTRPTGKPHEFAASENGPAVLCLSCGASGPLALGKEVQQGFSEAKHFPRAIRLWNGQQTLRMLGEAARLIEKASIITRRTSSFSTLHAELKHWLEYHQRGMR